MSEMSSFPISSVPFPSSPLSSLDDHKRGTKKDDNRNTIYFDASIWGDQFLNYDQKEDLVEEERLVKKLKEEVRKELTNKAFSESGQHVELIEFIDSIQRLGVAYHFDEEIEEALQHIYDTYGEQWIDSNNLQSISLWFRILRQQGFNISSGIFKNYMDEKGNFMESLCNDAQGMLALYEASYMRVEGEEILDKALEFTRINLANIANDPRHNDSPLQKRILEALKQPLRKRLARIEALRYVHTYKQEASHNENLLQLAKLDFNLLQSLHKRELSDVCKWWKNLDMQTKLPFVRDRVVEGFLWILGVYFEPQHSRVRVYLIKTCMWLIVLDDTYDNYGTYEELEAFTEATQTWSESCLDGLPEYMKLIYQELLDLHKELEESLEKEGTTFHIHYIKEMVKEYTRYLFVEAKWLKEGYTPTLKEQMSVSMVTCAYALMIAKAYAGEGDLVTHDTFKWVATYPPLVKASCQVLRLMDDMSTHQEEQQREHVPSSIECYMRENGVSEERACEYFTQIVEDAWKVMNKESLRPTDIPFPLIRPIVNLARVCDFLYKGNDGYGHAGDEVKYYIKSLFIHPLVV